MPIIGVVGPGDSISSPANRAVEEKKAHLADLEREVLEISAAVDSRIDEVEGFREAAKIACEGVEAAVEAIGSKIGYPRSQSLWHRFFLL